MNKSAKTKNRFLSIFSLVIAGEAVFFLPFVMVRIFRPTMLDFFGIDNTQLGYYFTVYGVVALISYFFGGILADRFQPRKLMALALCLTALVGFFISTNPKATFLPFAYGFWGFTSIFLFWAAMIRATREWGGSEFQGRAFGWLEGGRGATAAILGTVTFLLFSVLSVESGKNIISESGIHPFQYVMLTTSFLTFLAGFLVWFFVPDSQSLSSGDSSRAYPAQLKSLLKLPGIWLLMIMIICAYSGYKITDDFSLYARDVLNYSEAGAAGVGTSALWVRALVAVLAGFLGDRFSKTGMISLLFLISAISGMLIGLGFWSGNSALIILNLAFVAIGIYGVRALYFAVLREARVKILLTGSAVGIVSLLGYTPDIFMGPWMGYLLDNNPGEYGHQLVFYLLVGFSALGLIASLIFRKYSNTKQ